MNAIPFAYLHHPCTLAEADCSIALIFLHSNPEASLTGDVPAAQVVVQCVHQMCSTPGRAACLQQQPDRGGFVQVLLPYLVQVVARILHLLKACIAVHSQQPVGVLLPQPGKYAD